MAGGSVNFHILPLKLHGGVKCILRPTLTLSSALPVGSNEPNFKMYEVAINSCIAQYSNFFAHYNLMT